MRLVLLIGIQASGKSTFYQDRFRDTHLRINLDMLRKRHREQIVFYAGLAAQAEMCIDQMNHTSLHRARYLPAARAAGYETLGYWFDTSLDDALRRNATREGRARVPDVGVEACWHQQEKPRLDEGFDSLYRIDIAGGGKFYTAEMR